MAAALTLSETLFVALEPRPERDLRNVSVTIQSDAISMHQAKPLDVRERAIQLTGCQSSPARSWLISHSVPSNAGHATSVAIPCAGTRRADLRSGGRSALGGWPGPRSRASCWSMALRPRAPSPSRASCVKQQQREHRPDTTTAASDSATGVLGREGAQRVGSAAARDLLQRGSMTHPLHHHAQRTQWVAGQEIVRSTFVQHRK